MDRIHQRRAAEYRFYFHLDSTFGTIISTVKLGDAPWSLTDPWASPRYTPFWPLSSASTITAHTRPTTSPPVPMAPRHVVSTTHFPPLYPACCAVDVRRSCWKRLARRSTGPEMSRPSASLVADYPSPHLHGGDPRRGPVHISAVADHGMLSL